MCRVPHHTEGRRVGRGFVGGYGKKKKPFLLPRERKGGRFTPLVAAKGR